MVWLKVEEEEEREWEWEGCEWEEKDEKREKEGWRIKERMWDQADWVVGGSGVILVSSTSNEIGWKYGE